MVHLEIGRHLIFEEKMCIHYTKIEEYERYQNKLIRKLMGDSPNINLPYFISSEFLADKFRTVFRS